jgi:hypothetical protein
VSRWVGPFTASELIYSFHEMCRIWNDGLAILRESLATHVKNVRVQREYAVAEDDVRLAREMLPFCRRDSTVGFKSEIYDYSYSPAPLEEKIRHDAETIRTLAR